VSAPSSGAAGGPDRRLTCHVLDLTRGAPAVGLAIGLSRLDGQSPGRLLTTTTTNADGRTDEPLLAGGDLVAGRYALTFAVGDHFRRTGSGPDPGAEDDPPYLDVVPIHFGVAPSTGHLHVALLVTPFAYSTYRGS